MDRIDPEHADDLALPSLDRSVHEPVRQSLRRLAQLTTADLTARLAVDQRRRIVADLVRVRPEVREYGRLRQVVHRAPLQEVSSERAVRYAPASDRYATSLSVVEMRTTKRAAVPRRGMSGEAERCLTEPWRLAETGTRGL